MIGDLLACGKPPSEAQSKKIYDQEYEEVVARIKYSLNLTLQSPSYSVVLTSLLNPDIILPLRMYREQQGLPAPLLGHMLPPWSYELDGIEGLVDLSWMQQVQQIQQDDNDKDPLYNQYLYQEADDYDDDKEEMEVDDQPLGNAGNACPGAPTGTRWSYYHPKASYATHSQKPLASPQSIHTDMNAAMEFDNLNVAPQGPAREMTALDLVSCLTKGMANATVEVLEKSRILLRSQQQLVECQLLTGWTTISSPHRKRRPGPHVQR